MPDVSQRLTFNTTHSHDTKEEFNMDSNDECGQLNLAHVARNKKITRNILDCNQSDYSSRIILSNIPAKLFS